LAVADLNRDGILDLAVTNSEDGTLTIFLGKGDGTFGPAQNFGIRSQYLRLKLSLAVGDFNGDGIPDLVVVDPQSHPNEGMVNILLGNGDGTFQPALTFSAGFGPVSVAVGDFNGDGKQDLV